MVEKKVLYIGFKRQDGILIGGGLANKRCINTLKRRFGEQNVYEYYLLDEAKGRSLWSYLCAVFLFLFNYHNGLTPNKVSQIKALSKNYDYVFLTTSVIGIIAKKLKESGYQGKIITHYHNYTVSYHMFGIIKTTRRKEIYMTRFVLSGHIPILYKSAYINI